MGIMTLEQLVEDLRYAIGDNKDFEEPRLLRQLQFACTYLSAPNVYEHPELEAEETLALADDGSGNPTNIQTPVTVWRQIQRVHFYRTTPALLTPGSVGKILRPSGGIDGTYERSQLTAQEPSTWLYRSRQLHLDSLISTTNQGQTLKIWGFRTHKVVPTVLAGSESWVTEFTEDHDPIVLLLGEMYVHVARRQWAEADEIKTYVSGLLLDVPKVQDLTAQASGSPTRSGGMETMRRN